MLLQRKKIHMSFKKWSAAQDASRKDSPDDKSKPAPAADQPAAQPENTPAEVAPAAKS
ncbi:MAG: hypothetical protein OEU09_18330 [Rhodospirillales bacterium]|nr:hypothetical protein [Rhodospirillales bacterium]MDH3913243.1 hypothetical protein [Rhodospirillales bacterium]MDH3969217.1 hypothetical protein [Rhodospirillales bacterium]